jgi:hypothetical protein
MVHFFSNQGYPGHKAKSLVEIFKSKGLFEGVIFFGPHTLKVQFFHVEFQKCSQQI